MANRGVHKAYSRSLYYHSPQTRRRQNENHQHQNGTSSPNPLLQGHRRLEDSASISATTTGSGNSSNSNESSVVKRAVSNNPSSAVAAMYGGELTVHEYVRPRSKSQTTPRTSTQAHSSKSVSPIVRRSYPELFTDQQKSLLKHSWHHVGKHGHSGIGAMIFRRVFTRRPSLRRMFEFGATPAPRLQYDATFDIHARNFVSILDGSIRALDTSFEDDFGPELEAKGRFHAQFAERGFKSDYWDVFAEAMAESAVEWIGPGKHRETVRAWTLLISRIVDRMKIGYEDEVRRRKKSSQSAINAAYLQSDWNGGRSLSPSPPGYSPVSDGGRSGSSSGWLRENED